MKIEKTILKNLIPLQKYTKLRHKNPYLLNFFKGKQEIFYLGIEHSRNLKNKQFKLIEESLRKFLNRHEKNKIVIFLESFIPPLINNREKMIINFGETGLIYLISVREKLKVFCPEPSQEQNLDFVKNRKHNAIDIFLWIFINILYNKLATKKRKKLTEKITKETFTVIKKIIKTQKKFGIEKEFAKQLNLILRNKTKKSFFEILNELTLKEIKKLQDPFIKFSKLNKIGADFNLARDYYISKEIIKQLKRNKNIFAVFGKNHVICQEPILKKYFKK
ncbi:MAG: hypothetical protein HYW71_01395 [Candidatus Niyogibacteria bacterium]|nr:hypothetical protein [Candidatus Niyogibacteria bacterium]